MENSIYLGLSRQMTLQNNMDIIANNVANISTPGYRAQNLLFHEYISDPRGNEDPMSFVYDKGQYENTQAGSVQQTGNDLDVALNGPGFIGVVGPGGTATYTRGGNFQMRADGGLTTSSGFPVSNVGGGEIIIPPNVRSISIDEQGFVSTDQGILDQIKIVEFNNTQDLRGIGDNMYITEAAEQPPLNTRMRQGMLEGSNVKPVLEMVRMIDTLRSFQSVQNVLQSENQRLRTAIDKLTGGR